MRMDHGGRHVVTGKRSHLISFAQFREQKKVHVVDKSVCLVPRFHNASKRSRKPVQVNRKWKKHRNENLPLSIDSTHEDQS